MISWMPGEHGWTDHGPRITSSQGGEMKQNMPGDNPTEAGSLVDKGPRIMNTFDHNYSYRALLPMDIRGKGSSSDPEADPFLHQEDRPVGYNRPYREEPYINALHDFFEDKIALMPAKPRQDLGVAKDWLRSVMHDIRSTRDIAKDMGFADHTGVVKARQRAVDQLIESCGGKAALAEKLRQYLYDREGQDGRDRLKYLPRWIHG